MNGQFPDVWIVGDTAFIPCGSDTFPDAITVVDADVLPLVLDGKSRWTASRSGLPMTPYVMRRVDGVRERLHRLVLGVKNPKLVVDHISGDTLDNRRRNLRAGAQRDNARNRRGRLGRSLPKGVKLLPGGRFWARITVDRRELALGSYPTLVGAMEAYDRAAAEYFGDFARQSAASPKGPVHV